MVKTPPAMQETWEWQPTPVFWAAESHEQRSLMGYSPWGRKESDMTERLTLSPFSHIAADDLALPTPVRSLVKLFVHVS